MQQQNAIHTDPLRRALEAKSVERMHTLLSTASPRDFTRYCTEIATAPERQEAKRTLHAIAPVGRAPLSHNPPHRAHYSIPNTAADH